MSETAQVTEESLTSLELASLGLAQLELVEAKWDEIVNQTVANSGQFQEECKRIFDAQ